MITYKNVLAYIFFGLIFPLMAHAQQLGMVNFAFDSDQLDAAARTQIEKIAEDFHATDSYKPLVIVGYTDAVGASGYNQSLGLRRAQKVANALAAAGVPVSRIGTIESRGERELLVSVATAERANRRATVDLGTILAACRSYRDISLPADAAGDALQNDLRSNLSEAAQYYQQIAQTGSRSAAFQMAGAARSDCEQAVGFRNDSVRKLEYAKRCFCSHARMRAALN